MNQIDEALKEGFENKEGNWDLRTQKENEIITWTRWYGTDVNYELPLTRAMHIFPNCNDPEKILKAFNDERS